MDSEKEKRIENRFLRGKELATSDFLDFIKPDEGELLLIYGKIGQGKTYNAVRMIFDDLMRGKIVYSTFPIDWSGFDERKSIIHLFFRRKFFYFPKENWHFLDPYSSDIWDQLLKLSDCKIYFDDCIVALFDSYEKTLYAKKKRQWAFETRHYDRTIVIVTQRPNQVQVALRSQVNRFYRCTKIWQKFFLIFKVEEFQEMVGETVNDTVEPDSKEFFRSRKHILNAYQTKYLRDKDIPIQKLYYQVFYLTFKERFFNIKLLLFSKFGLKSKFRKKIKKIAVKSDSEPRGVKLNRVAIKDTKQGGHEQVGIGRQIDLPF